MNGRDRYSEEAAAQAVNRVIGGTWELHDTGRADSQFDIALVTDDGRKIALEATSFGGDVWKQTRARVEAARERRLFDDNGVRWQWLVVITPGTGVRELHPREAAP